MRVLHVVHYPVFGGPHNQALRLAAPLRARGWEITALLPEESGNAAGRLEEAGIEVLRTPMRRLRALPDPRVQARFAAALPADVRRIRKVIRDEAFDLVVVAGLANPHAAIAARLAGVPVVWQIVDSRAPMPLRRTLMPVVTRLADVVMTTGVTIAREHPGATGLGRRWVTFFPPVDTGEYRPDADRRRIARQELGLQVAAPVMGTVGNLNPQKGHGALVEGAAPALRSDPGARLVILGAETPTHPRYRDELVRLATSLGVADQLLIRDAGSRVAEMLPAFDVFVMTPVARSEGVPTVILEAMAAGLPVVATPAGGIREVVEDGRTGIVTARDAGSIATAIERLLGDEVFRAGAGQLARFIALERYGLERCADSHVRAFEIAREHHAGRRRTRR